MQDVFLSKELEILYWKKVRIPKIHSEINHMFNGISFLLDLFIHGKNFEETKISNQWAEYFSEFVCLNVEVINQSFIKMSPTHNHKYDPIRLLNVTISNLGSNDGFQRIHLSDFFEEIFQKEVLSCPNSKSIC
jgi:hypothetical protein